jgi:nuclear pore complex protein Nup188
MLSLQALASLTTLSFLKLPASMSAVWKNASPSQSEVPAQSRPYFLSREHIADINEIFLNCVNMGILSASPAVFAWGTILHSMRDLALTAKETREMEQFHSAVDSFHSNTPSASPGRGSEQTLYEELLDLARIPGYGDDFVAILTTGAIERGQVFEVTINLASKVGKISAIDDVVTKLWIRSSLLGIVRVSSLFLDYSPEIVEASLAILNGSNPDSVSRRDDSIIYPSDPRYVFLRDNELMDRIFRIARSRFPYESVPFLRLCRALTGKDQVGEDGTVAILAELETMETFTQMISPDFHGYETIREEENANFVSLVQPIPMISQTSKRPKTSPNAETALIVTAGSQIQPATTGQVVSESKPAVIMWYHQYSCLSFLGSWLEEWANIGGSSSAADEESIAEIIGLLTDLMAAARSGKTQGEDESGSKRVLEIASDGLASRGDIVSVVFDILERQLQSVGVQALDLTIACLQFVDVLITVLPNRVWPFLSRSSLLGSGGQGGRMTAIVSASEVTSGDYPVLLSCVGLFDAVVEDAISHAAIRRTSNRSGSRTSSTADWSAGVPSHVISKTLLGFVRTMVEVYNSDGNWRFNEPEQRLQIDSVLAGNFEKILYYAYGIDETEPPESKITGIFSASASYILDVLRPSSKDELPFNPVLRIIIDGLQTPRSTVYLRQLIFVERQLKSTLKLAIKLIEAAQLVGSSVSLLEDQLFKAAPVLVKLYCLHDRYRLPVITLLDLLVSRAAADAENEPPSLLGHLGAESSCLFLDVLAQFDKPLYDSHLLVSIWRLMSTFVSKRQQWLAVYILTGSSPRESLKQRADGKKAPAMRGTPFLKTALDTLVNIEQIQPLISLALLEFVSHSQEHWPWATPQLGKHPNFFSSLIHYVAHLKIGGRSATTQIYLTQIGAITADLCAIYLHSAKEARDQSFFKTLIPLVSWFSENAVDVSGYNASLHANLNKNFEMKYSGCKLHNFKRTPLQTRPLGKDYYYDMHLAGKLLSFDFAWRGKKNQGFAEEFERANLNLSLVEAQVVGDRMHCRRNLTDMKSRICSTAGNSSL